MAEHASLNDALDAEAQGRFVDALKHYLSLLKINPRHEEALLGVGRVRLLLGKFDAAVEDFTAVLVGNPLSAEGYRGRGVPFFNKGLIDKAFDDMDKAIGLAPDDLDIRLSRGQIARDLGALDIAVRDLERAHRLAPHDADVNLELARCILRREDAADRVDEVEALLTVAARGFGMDDPLIGLLELAVRRLRGATVDKAAILAFAAEDEEVADEVSEIPILTAIVS